MVRGPDSTHTLVDTRDGLVDTLDLVSAGVPQQLGLLQDLRGLHVGDADGLLPAVDVVADHDGVLPRPRRHGELDGRVSLGELGEMGLDEGAGRQVAGQLSRLCYNKNTDGQIGFGALLHASRAAGVVAVVDV